MRFGSVCSGIEAASVAWHPLGWQAAWFAEIEPFPCAVLAHHYPSVPNLGDMTAIAGRVLSGAVEAPDVLVGGTPCQAFSVAGMREGLSDARGALTLKFVELANAIDHVRGLRGKQPAIVVWENVPGVLSSRDNAFGCFLGALAGSGCELQPAGGKWTDAGCVYGPQRAVAWRILDAQYFGLAQRRRRVFVVASARAGTDPAAVLFEREGLRRDTPPRRGQGKDLAGRAPFGPALQCGCGHIFGRELGQYGCPNCEGDDGPAVSILAGVPAFGGDKAEPLFKAETLTAHGGRQDFASESFVMQPSVGVDLRNGAITDQVASTMQAGDHAPDPGGTPHVLQPACFVQNSRSEVRLVDGDGQITGALAADAGAQQQHYIAQCVTGDITHARKAEGFDGSEDGTGRGQPIVAFTASDYKTGGFDEVDVDGPLTTSTDRSRAAPIAAVAMRVRRITPIEGERLQGFPDNYTLVPYRNSMAPDGPRYKAIGNSMATYVMHWIGCRIDMHLNRNQEAA